MHDSPIRLDHVGIAVENIADGEPVLEALGCEKLSDEPGPDDTYRWAYYRLGNASRLELVAPLTDDSFIQSYIDDHGVGLHHVTLEVADLPTVRDAIEASGYDVVDETTYDGWTEAFVSPRNPTGVLFQLMEYHDDYHHDRANPETLYIDGVRVGETP